jgi:RNA polymerase sigma-B factor
VKGRSVTTQLAGTRDPGAGHDGIPVDDVRETPEVDRLLEQLASLDPGTPEYQRLRERIVEQNLPLVRQLARRYRSRSEPMEDILQAGAVGLVKAIDRYEPERGAFLPFAIPTILGEIKRFFRDTSWSVRVPRRLRDRRLELFRMTDNLTQRLGRGPTVAELASHLRLTEDEVTEGLDACAAYSTSSLDAPALAGDDAVTLADQLGEEDEELDLVEQREGIEPALEELPARQREILLMRYYGNMTQAQIGEQVGLSQMHVSRLLTRSIDQLRERLCASA